MTNTLAYYGTELIAGVKSFTSEGGRKTHRKKKREGRREKRRRGERG